MEYKKIENQIKIYDKFDTDLKQIKVLIQKYKDFELEFMGKTVKFFMELEKMRENSFKEFRQIESLISHNTSSLEIMKSVSMIFEAFIKFVKDFLDNEDFLSKSFLNLGNIATEIENEFSNYGEIRHYYNSICYANKLIELEITKNLVKEKYKEDLVYDDQKENFVGLVKKSNDNYNYFFASKEMKMQRIRRKTSESEKILKENIDKIFIKLSEMRNDFAEVEEKEKKRIEDLFTNTDNKNNKRLNLLVNFDYFKYTPNIISNNSFTVKRKENDMILDQREENNMILDQHDLDDQDIYDIVSKLYQLDLESIKNQNLI